MTAEARDQAGRVDRLWREHHVAVKRFLYWKVRDDAVADDLLNETFLAVVLKPSAVPDDADPLPWLFGVARNKLRSHWRQQRRRGETALADRHDNGLVDPGGTGLSELQVDLAKAGTRLPRRGWDVLVFTFLQDLTDDQIALLVGASTVNVRQIRKRALDILRCALADYDQRMSVLMRRRGAR